MTDFKKAIAESLTESDKETAIESLRATVSEMKRQGMPLKKTKKLIKQVHRQVEQEYEAKIHNLELEKDRASAQVECLKSVRDHNVSAAMAIQKFKEAFPEEWEQISPRIYKNVENYGDYRLAWLEWAWAHVLKRFNDEEGKISTDAHRLALNCFNEHQEHGFPFFFVSKGLCDAAWKSDLKFAVDWKAMRLPFEAFTFIAPKNNPFGEPRIEGIIVYRYMKDGDVHFNLSVLGNGGLGTEIAADYPFEADDSWDANVLRWVFNTIYIMAARPEYVEGGNRVGTHKHSQSEIWTPNIIGHKYAVKSHHFVSNERKGTVRLHWRRGHFRQQVFGIKRGKRKVIWIEPMMVGGEKAVSD